MKINNGLLPCNLNLKGYGSEYKICNVIGRGDFGITYLGIDIKMKSKVAIKEYFPCNLVSRKGSQGALFVLKDEYESKFKKGLKRFAEEAERLLKVGSLEGIVRIICFFYANGTAYLVMEYIEGDTLDVYLEKNGGRIEWSRASMLVKPVIMSLKIIHKQKILHKDIKPQNIMISLDEKMTLIDFGSARSIVDEKIEYTINMQRGYSPPELQIPNGKIGAWSDVYSFCAILYRMVSGQIMQTVLDAEKIIPLGEYDNTIPVQVQKVIIKGLNSNVKDRIQDMGELYDYLYSNYSKKIIKKLFNIILRYGILVILLLGVIGVGRYLMDKSRTIIISEFVDMDVSANDILKDLIYKKEGSEIIITGTNNTIKEVIIPSEVEGLKVTRISGLGTNVTKLVLPSTLREIESFAFRNCMYLEEVYIPENISIIESNAFDNCISLEKITVSPDNYNYYVENNMLYDSSGRIVCDFNRTK